MFDIVDQKSIAHVIGFFDVGAGPGGYSISLEGLGVIVIPAWMGVLYFNGICVEGLGNSVPYGTVHLGLICDLCVQFHYYSVLGYDSSLKIVFIFDEC